MLNSYSTSLDKEALLHLRGPDALSFLQGQVTCDTRELTVDGALTGLYCTVQGRVVCDFLLFSLEQDHLVLRMRRDIRASSAALFAKYIVFSKAQLEAEREDWQVIACWGPGSAGTLQHVFGTLPRERYGACRGEGFVLVQMDAAGHQFECYLGPDATELAGDLREHSSPGTEADWQAGQIATGIARIGANTTGEYVPQLLNYDLTGHISFTKGCYTGQEVVARLHYRGKPKRRLSLADIGPDAIPTDLQSVAGDALYSSDSPKAVGNIINCVRDAEGRCAMLVTATEAGLASGLRLSTPDGPLLKTGPVPYPVPEK